MIKKETTYGFLTKKNSMSNDDHKFEKRFRNFLSLQHFGAQTIENMMTETEKILALCSDPESNEKRRGMVIGDVQSGKTSNYFSFS